jgi:hypothetical protein
MDKSWFQLRHVFAGLFIEVIQAGLAAKADLCAFMREDMGLAHAVEFFTGNDTGGERVGACVRIFAAGSEGKAG